MCYWKGVLREEGVFEIRGNINIIIFKLGGMNEKLLTLLAFFSFPSINLAFQNLAF
jgi:hypothetical protein